MYGDPALANGDIYTSRLMDARRYPKSCTVISDIQNIGHEYNAVILNCPKQQDESEGLLALALQRSQGFVMAVAANDAGGGRLQKMMKEYGVPFDTLTKDHCRIVWTNDAKKADKAVIAKHMTSLDARIVNMDGEDWWSVPGLFGWNKIDPGSQILLQHIPKDISGIVADFGCGYGYISAKLAREFDGISEIQAFDCDARAVKATAKNGGAKVRAEWQDITKLPEQYSFDVIVMNPPFHSGKQQDINIGENFIRAAWQRLKQNGRLFFVANRHLPYEKIVPGLTKLYEYNGYKIIAGQKP
jgi:16S rRNA (guanine1207-N2)-methyltransferase